MVHNIEHSYMTSCSIYMRDIKASGPACHPRNHSKVLQSRLTGHLGVAVITHHITKPTPLPAVVKWPRSWTGWSNHHFTRTLVEAPSPISWRKPHSRLLTSTIFLLYRQRKGGRISDAAIFSFQESSFWEALIDSHSLFFARFYCDCGFLSITFCLSVHWWILEH